MLFNQESDELTGGKQLPSNMVLVEDGVVFGLTPAITAGRVGHPQCEMLRIARSLEEFKSQVLAVRSFLPKKEARPSRRFSFGLTDCFSNAEEICVVNRESISNFTDIVLVNATGCIQQVWKGDMKPGDTIPIHSMCSTVDQEILSTSHQTNSKLPREGFNGLTPVEGERVILFLMHPNACALSPQMMDSRIISEETLLPTRHSNFWQFDPELRWFTYSDSC
jgi:hypothetical protein